MLRGLFSSCGEQGLFSSGGAWASHRSGSSCCGARALVPTDLFCGSRAREPRTSGCDAWAQLRSSHTRRGTRVPCFGRGAILYHWAARIALRRILDSSFPRSYLVREAWEPAVLSHSAGSAIKSSGASSERLPLPPSCLTLCDYADYSPPGSSVHGISQARLLEWVAISFSMCITFTSSQSIKS